MFSITVSNRCENLLDTLLARLETAQGTPFARSHVITPGSALRRRIELAMAERTGICAGINFDYLAQWLWRQIARIVEVPEISPYAPPVLAWRIFAALDGPWTLKHARLTHYLAGADARKRFELAERLACLFDHYLSYRTIWLERWAAGKTAFAAHEDDIRADEAWQAELWRQIHGDAPPRLPFMHFLRRAAQMDEAEPTTTGLPASVNIFCLPTLPPLHLEMLRTLARTMDVHVYVLNPCREYWFDIVDARRLSWLAQRQRDMFHETGNTLLAAWGKQTQAHVESLFEGETPVLEEAVFTPHPAHHLLARLHNAILDLQELDAGGIHLDDDDRSIELHLCHSRIRELEVLHDRLLGLFSQPKPPRPDEILVLTPRLAACAPLIEAVFGTAPRERHIPWRITGLGNTEENPVARVLDSLLTLAAGRAPASRVFDLLQQPLVAAHFGLDEAGLEQIRTWMDGAGIRWGLDAEHVHATGADGGHTAETGLARLFLSWAAGDAASRSLFAGHVGVAPPPKGSAGLALGAFWRYTRNLNRLRAELLQTHDAETWRAVLSNALNALIGEAPGHAEEMRSVREAINALADDIATGSGKETRLALPLDVIHPALAARLDEGARGGVPGGAVTFSALPSLRGLPYRVICLIGLDCDDFPNRERIDEFDLMAARPQKGDRQRGNDERNLFLDAILAAHDVLHLSCVGRSARDNAELQASVLVDELLDALATACADNPKQPESLARARARLIVEHPLQSFAPAYFMTNRNGRLQNFRTEFAGALAARSNRQQERAAERQAPLKHPDDADEDGPRDDNPFFARPLPPPHEDWRRVDLVRLKRFFRNPCRFLLHERLGLDPSDSDASLVDIEPFIPGWPSYTALARRLLPALLDEGQTGETNRLAEDEIFALAHAGGEYPAGALGENALRRELSALRSFADRVNAACAKPLLPAHAIKLDFDLDGETWELRAELGALRADGLIYQRYDDTRAGDYLAAWIDHLALCAAPPPGVALQTRALLRNGNFALRALPPDTARVHLEKLLALYRVGLREPLHFFPKSAWEYACHDDKDSAHAAADKKWAGGNFPEKNEAAYRLALRGTSNALDDIFQGNAMEVFSTLRLHLDEVRLS